MSALTRSARALVGAPIQARTLSTILLRPSSLRLIPTIPHSATRPSHTPRRHFLGVPGSLSQTIGEQPAPDGKGTIPVVLASDARSIWNEFGCIVDVREKHEVDEGMIEGAIHRPLGMILENPKQPEFAGKKCLVYCRAGIRSAKAVQAMQNAGIDAVNMGGGFLAYLDTGAPIVVPEKK